MTYTDHELLNCCLHVCVDPDMTLVAWKRNPHCFLLRVGGGGGTCKSGHKPCY